MHVPSWEGSREKRQLLVPNSYITNTTPSRALRKSMRELLRPRKGGLVSGCNAFQFVGFLFCLFLVFVVQSDYLSNTCLWRGRHVVVKSYSTRVFESWPCHPSTGPCASVSSSVSWGEQQCACHRAAGRTSEEGIRNTLRTERHLLALLRKTSSRASGDRMMVNKTGLHLVPLPMLPGGRPGSYPPPPPQGPGWTWHLLIVLEISADQTKDEMSTDTICLLLCSYHATLWTPRITPGYSNTPGPGSGRGLAPSSLQSLIRPILMII